MKENVIKHTWYRMYLFWMNENKTFSQTSRFRNLRSLMAASVSIKTVIHRAMFMYSRPGMTGCAFRSHVHVF